MSWLQQTWRIATIGDSITRGDFSASASWLDGGGPALLNHFLPAGVNPSGHRSVQQIPIMFADGVSGFSWVDWASLIVAELAGLYGHVDLLNFELNINDALFIHSGTETLLGPGSCDEAMDSCIAAADARWPGVRVSICGAWNAKSPFPSIETEITAVNALAQAKMVARGDRGRYIDWHSVPMITAGPGQNTVDGVHCNQLGAQQLGARFLRDILS